MTRVLIITAIVFSTIIIFCSSILNTITSALLTMFLVSALSIIYHRENIFSMKSLFTASWIGSLFLSSLKLHYIQREWSLLTWVVLFCTYIFFLIGYDIKKNIKICRNFTQNYSHNSEKERLYPNRYFYGLILLSIFIIACFLLECMFAPLPILSKSMSSYVNFGLPIVHYVTVSCILVPPLADYYCTVLSRKKCTPRKTMVLILAVLNGIIPILIVSRQLLLEEIIVFVITHFAIKNRTPNAKNLLTMGTCILFAWVIGSAVRNQDDTYLNHVLELGKFKFPGIPVKLKTIYLYISLNFDNFDYNTQLIQFQGGRYSIMPILALFGVRKLVPGLVGSTGVRNFYSTFNTMPMSHYGYVDFGLPGVIVYMTIVGYACASFENEQKDNICKMVISSLMKYGLIMSFFYSVFSNTAFYGYIIVLVLFDKLFLRRRYDRTSDVCQSIMIEEQ